MSRSRRYSTLRLTILFFIFLWFTPVQAQEDDTTLPPCTLSDTVEYVDLPENLSHLTQPKLNIPIPGFSFRKQVFKVQQCIDLVTGKPVLEKAKTTFVISALCDYMQALFKLAVGFAILLAVIVIMHNGLRWAASAGSATAISEAKNGISNALVGLLLLLCGVLLLRIINPDLVICRPFLVEKPTLPAATLVGVTSIPTDLITLSNPNTTDTLSKDVQDALTVVLKKIQDDNPWASFQGTDKKPRLADASRSVVDQLRLFVDHCVFPGGQRSANFLCNRPGDGAETPTCKPWRGVPAGFQEIADGITGTSGADINMLTRDGVLSYITQNAKLDPDLCPHTTGVAVDLWAPGVTKSLIFPTVTSQEAFERQKKLIGYMIDGGFCVLTGGTGPQVEYWHFELNARRKSLPGFCVTTKP